MTTSLDAIRRKLCSRVRTLDAAFDRNFLVPSSRRRIDRFALQEGLVSVLWQSWCAFSRATLIGSASGSVRASGQQVTSPYAGRSEMEIAYVAKVLSEGHQVKRIKELRGRHQEPTWGDLDKVNKIASGLNSTNQPQLLTAFGAGLAVRDLQLCRNASAHVHKDMLDQINSAKVRYSETKFAHPSDLIYWVDPTTKGFLWKTWVDEMLLISQHAIV
jgi:hypothetical protein